MFPRFQRISIESPNTQMDCKILLAGHQSKAGATRPCAWWQQNWSGAALRRWRFNCCGWSRKKSVRRALCSCRFVTAIRSTLPQTRSDNIK